MEFVKTAKVQIHPEVSEQKLLLDSMRVYSDACTFVSEYVYTTKDLVQVSKVNPRYTSQTCPRCGHIEAGNRDKAKHIFCCKNCGYTSNDDRIGAMNLYRMGIEYLVESQVSTSDL